MLQWREVAAEKHYMKGGKIGEFPKFDPSVIPGGAEVPSTSTIPLVTPREDQPRTRRMA